MTTYESALSELSTRLIGTGSNLTNSLSEILAAALQELIEAELTAAIGAAPGERTDRALWAVIMTAYVTGTSTRKVDDLVKALGCDSGVSKSTVSRICKDIDADVAVLRTRTLGHQPFVYVWLDATYVHVREHRHVVSKAVVIATGLRHDGRREVLGVDIGDSENETFWSEFLGGLNDRGLAGVKLVISDAVKLLCGWLVVGGPFGGELVRAEVAVDRVGSVDVVVDSPVLDDHSGFEEAVPLAAVE
jgi:putative transposase